MIVSDKKKFVYIHSAKTGGSSLTHALAPYSNRGNPKAGKGHGWQIPYHYGPMHDTLAQSWTKYGKPQWEDYFWFAFVRNPFDLCVSAWRNAIAVYADPRPKERIKFEALGIECGIKDISLEQYLRNELGLVNRLHVRRTQTETLITDAPRSLNRIGRFETLNEDFAKISQHLGINPLLPHRNKSKREEGYRQYYCDTTRELVEAFYKEDLENFNYEF